MKIRYSQILALAVLLLMTGNIFADKGKNIRIRVFLSGAQEVSPPAPTNGVETDTTGRLDIAFDRLLTEAEFRLVVRDGLAVTQAHLHCGRAGENGPVVVFLFGLEADGVEVDGELSRGTLTNTDITEVGADCVGPIGQPVNNIASLAAAIRAGLIYVNVHSVANPPGVVRGQFLAK